MCMWKKITNLILQTSSETDISVDHNLALFERTCITDLRMANGLYNIHHDCHSATKVFICYVSKH